MDNKALMTIFETYDEDATARSVASFFKTFKKIILIAGESITSLKSPVINGMPANHDGKNHQEEKVVEHANATDIAPKVFKDVQFALSVISERSRKIITGTYIDELTGDMMAAKLGYSESTFKRFKKVALNEFADAMTSNKTYLHLDLHAK